MFLWKSYAAVVLTTPSELVDRLILVQRLVQFWPNQGFTKEFPCGATGDVLVTSSGFPGNVPNPSELVGGLRVWWRGSAGHLLQKWTNWNEYIWFECVDVRNGSLATELRPLTLEDTNKTEILGNLAYLWARAVVCAAILSKQGKSLVKPWFDQICIYRCTKINLSPSSDGVVRATAA